MRLPEVGTGEEYEFWVDSETGETIKIILWTRKNFLTRRAIFDV